MKFYITEQGKPQEIAGVTMTLQINSVFTVLDRARPWKNWGEGDINSYFDLNVIADNYIQYVVDAGIFERFEGSPTRFSFTPLGKRVWVFGFFTNPQRSEQLS